MARPGQAPQLEIHDPEAGGESGAKYPPELRDLFFIPGQPRTRRVFTRDAAGRVDGFVDRREGEDVRCRRSSQ